MSTWRVRADGTCWALGIAFARVARPGPGSWTVTEISNHSAGRRPDLTSWHQVASALERADPPRPGHFTHEVVFRRRTACEAYSAVREKVFVRVFRGGNPPPEWNVAS